MFTNGRIQGHGYQVLLERKINTEVSSHQDTAHSESPQTETSYPSYHTLLRFKGLLTPTATHPAHINIPEAIQSLGIQLRASAIQLSGDFSARMHSDKAKRTFLTTYVQLFQDQLQVKQPIKKKADKEKKRSKVFVAFFCFSLRSIQRAEPLQAPTCTPPQATS